MILNVIGLIITILGMLYFGIDWVKDHEKESFSKSYFIFLVLMFIAQWILCNNSI